MRKIAPCGGCGKTTMTVSKDDIHFYCNRCLPYFARQGMYPTVQQTSSPVVTEQKEQPRPKKKK